MHGLSFKGWSSYKSYILLPCNIFHLECTRWTMEFSKCQFKTTCLKHTLIKIITVLTTIKIFLVDQSFIQGFTKRLSCTATWIRLKSVIKSWSEGATCAKRYGKMGEKWWMDMEYGFKWIFMEFIIVQKGWPMEMLCLMVGLTKLRRIKS